MLQWTSIPFRKRRNTPTLNTKRLCFPFTALCQSQGKVYADCGLTCENFLLSDAARASRCKPGCYCPGNKLLLENGTCVEKNDCGCKHNNKFYKQGDVSPVDCSKQVYMVTGYLSLICNEITPPIREQHTYDSTGFFFLLLKLLTETNFIRFFVQGRLNSMDEFAHGEISCYCMYWCQSIDPGEDSTTLKLVFIEKRKK